MTQISSNGSISSVNSIYQVQAIGQGNLSEQSKVSSADTPSGLGNANLIEEENEARQRTRRNAFIKVIGGRGKARGGGNGGGINLGPIHIGGGGGGFSISLSSSQRQKMRDKIRNQEQQNQRASQEE